MIGMRLCSGLQVWIIKCKITATKKNKFTNFLIKTYMFNKKILNVFAMVVAALLALKLVLDLIVFVWALVAIPTWTADPTLNKVLSLVTDIGTIMFLYLVVAALRSLAVPSTEKAPKTPILPLIKKVASRK